MGPTDGGGGYERKKTCLGPQTMEFKFWEIHPMEDAAVRGWVSTRKGGGTWKKAGWYADAQLADV